MVHPDYQYTPRLVTAMRLMITSGEYDAVLGSRILAAARSRAACPRYKYVRQPPADHWPRTSCSATS
jgi:hypothetical protein